MLKYIILIIEILSLQNLNEFIFGNSQPLQLKDLTYIILVVGGFIILTLIYVSYRKFKGEKQHTNKEKAVRKERQD